ncbi:NB-ARC domain-containing protein [Streptomyces sp. NPDC050610]|uniref:NB-ARC domain-containing protein n=1 Tax=Streptomyces sp. NPDC050610 TaxID=3157097 RepID=UPI003423BD7C
MSDVSDGRAAAQHVTNELSGNVYGPSVQAGQIHGGIAYTIVQPPGPESRPKPDQVPPLTARFVNRTRELTALDGWLSGSGAGGAGIGLGLLTGLPGVGKTATACRWAQLSRDLFPDGQIYIDFSALRDGEGADVSEAVAQGLRALGVDNAFMPDSLAERTALFRTHSAGRRVLVVLDDVNHPAQVRPLVPKGPGSALLVTSNARLGELTLDGARLMPLDPLDHEGGMRLLAARCGEDAVAAEPAAAERLVELCGGLPVALRVVAARLVASPRLTMTRLADELADETRRLTGMALRGEKRGEGRGEQRGEHSVSAVLGPAYRELEPAAARLYRLLGWLPARTFDHGTAAVAADLGPADAEPLLDDLVAASLLDVTPEGRYRQHDLVRLHARERAAEEEPEAGRRALTERVVTHYLALTALADRAIRADRLRVADLDGFLSGAPDPFADADADADADTDLAAGPPPLAWLEAERANILAVLREAARYGLHTPVWQLAEAFTVLFLHHRHLADWKETLEIGAAAATESVAPAAEARLRSLLSRPLMDLGAYDRARTELEAAVACADVSGHTVLRASVQEFSGRYWDRFDPARAMAAYQLSLDLNTEAGEGRGAAIAAYFLGCARDAGGDHRGALDTLRDAYERLAERGDSRMAARALAAMGAAHDHAGETAAAVRALTEAARVLREGDATHYEAQALVLLADVEERTGGGRAAVRAHLTRAFEIYSAGGSPAAEALWARLEGLEGLEGQGS